MPEKLERCVSDLKAQGKPEDSAWPICIDSTGEKPHKESIEETVMREVLDASMNRSCKCQKNKKKKPYKSYKRILQKN